SYLSSGIASAAGTNWLSSHASCASITDEMDVAEACGGFCCAPTIAPLAIAAHTTTRTAALCMAAVSRLSRHATRTHVEVTIATRVRSVAVVRGPDDAAQLLGFVNVMTRGVAKRFSDGVEFIRLCVELRRFFELAPCRFFINACHGVDFSLCWLRPATIAGSVQDRCHGPGRVAGRGARLGHEPSISPATMSSERRQCVHRKAGAAGHGNGRNRDHE